MKVLFLSKKHDVHSEKALTHLNQFGWEVVSCFGVWGEKLPPDAQTWDGDLIISYLSRWVVPESLLVKAKVGAINFHPAPPEYPGIGCINFALYNNEGTFGATCHHMLGKVDTGKIIKVKRFPVYEKDNIQSLLERTYDYQLSLFYDVMDQFYTDKAFPESQDEWSREAYTRKEFNELFKISLEMDEEETNKRIRAISFNEFQPWIEFHGKKFYYKSE
ncbi:formyltransferase family protein [Pseudoalteromonas sp. SSM20]|uniref:formyltransferase family protein n=1 Tax=Pseudoalteromonas sp. SSM20 TaxID=3139394 RepID=UPI003BA96C5D